MSERQAKFAVACLIGALLTALLIGTAQASKPAKNTLVFTRHGGVTFSFPDTKVSCGASSEGGGRRAIKIQSLPTSSNPPDSHFTVEAILGDVASHPTVKFPNTSVFGHPKGAFVFVFDRQDPLVTDGNEASSEQEEASGKIVFHKARCKPRPQVAFTIHGNLGSEFFGVHRIAVDGFYRGRAK